MNGPQHYCEADARAEKAEAEVKRLTSERDAAVARAERAERSADRSIRSLATTERVIRERNEARDALDRLRAGIEDIEAKADDYGQQTLVNMANALLNPTEGGKS